MCPLLPASRRPKDRLVDLARLERDLLRAPVPTSTIPISWSSSGPADIAASSLRGTFTEAHILAITQAICEYRKAQGIDGPAVSWAKTRMRFRLRRNAPRWRCWRPTTWRPLIQRDDGFTPTPAVSHAILIYNRGRTDHLADGIVITPSHNPPEDGGFKYNPPNGGPADTDVTRGSKIAPTNC